MTALEAKSILTLYRPGTADAQEPQMAEALALAETDPELSLWLEMHLARHEAMRTKFSQITPPPGLKEQILSEQAASKHPVEKRPVLQLMALALIVLLLGGLAFFWFSNRTPMPDNTLASFQRGMVSVALRNYAMDLNTNDPVPVHAFLAEKNAPADFNLPTGLQKTPLVGCATEAWQGTTVSLVCFRTGKPLPPGSQADLWLFVANRSAVRNAPATATPEFTKINILITATWTDGDKIYLLGVQGGETDIKQYL